ncbi:hypothetical protein TVAG_094480 [Trichomonas vaginalis G3]|uniref:Uncharacterized protein n=1 Tax=Trichomonas vaginalis (strain ATCC PRA-98 / G3) TaxID=412133 RepID=A2DBS0_TRIV3|nr:hypothetical protein TVAGG3_0380760 [Trichomonas vaginalis G3]EAY22273.1 hypothetical protein TVAG_094480 [Trichomonas vaginalis G3]KAI5533257.1 hypothetical protein TVAGG3_0380760 [Trichomonas vaginalis G3]|eukprot:XP_001583259.1 hypothetical protein [Trichomonas vaginalis G3]
MSQEKVTVTTSSSGSSDAQSAQSGEVVIINGKRFLKTTTTSQESTHFSRTTTVSKTTITRKRIVATLIIIKLTIRDFIGFASFHPFIFNIRPIGMDIRSNKDIVVEEYNKIWPIIKEAEESLPFPENQEDAVYNFCWKYAGIIYYSTILILEMKNNKVDLNSIAEFSTSHDNIIQFLKDEHGFMKEKNPEKFRPQPFMTVARTIHQTCKDIKIMMRQVNIADVKDSRVQPIMTELESQRKAIKAAIKPVIQNEKTMTMDIYRTCRRTFITAMRLINNLVYKVSIIDHAMEFNTNLAFYLGVLAENVQLFQDGEQIAKDYIEEVNPDAKSHKKPRRSEGAQPQDDNPVKSRDAQISLAETKPKAEDSGAPISLSELRSGPGEDEHKPIGNWATSTDSLMKKKDGQLRLKPDELGSQSVSLFMLKQKRKSILLDPSEEQGLDLHNSTFPHVTFNFERTGPLENEQSQMVDDTDSSPLLSQSAPEQPLYDRDHINPDLYPQPIKIPNFSSWHSQTISKQIRQPRAPAVSLDKLKSHSAKRSKLGFLSGSMSNIFSSSHDFKSMRIKKIEDVLVAPEIEAYDPDYAEEQLEDSIVQLQKCREEYQEIENNSIEEKAFFFCKWQSTFNAAPQLVKITQEKKPDSESIKVAIDLLTSLSHANDEVVEQLQEKSWESPRDAINHVTDLLRIIIISLNYAEEDLKNHKLSNINAQEVADWKRYYTEMLQNIEIINSAHDNVVCLQNLKYIGEARSHWSSFGPIAQSIDRETNRSILVITHKTLINTADLVILYIKTAELTDLTTRPQMIGYLEAARSKLQVVKKLKVMSVASIVGLSDTLITQIITELNVKNVHLKSCDADRFCQQLGDITNKVEAAVPNIKNKEQVEAIIEFHEFTTAARYNLLNMRVQDSEKEPDLLPLLKQNVEDLDMLEKQFRSASQDTSATPTSSDFCLKWASQIEKFRLSLISIEEVSDVMLRNPSRYDAADVHLINIGKNIRVFERSDFNFLVPVTANYTRTTTNLQITIDYLTDTPNKLRRQGLESNKQTQQPIFQGLQPISIKPISGDQMQQQKTTIIIDLKPYVNGFIDNPAEIKSHISDAMPQDEASDKSISDKLQRQILRLSAAQTDALSRNYNLSTKSTDVLFSLVITYCQSLIYLAPLIEDALELDDVTEVRKVVTQHIKKLNAIQSSYNDKAVYSEFAQKRLMIFAQTCKVLARVTELNLSHLTPDVQFNESALSSDMRQLTVNIAFFPKFPSVPAAMALKDVIRSHKAAHEDMQFDLMPVIQSESKFLARIMEIIQNFYAEADVRFFRLESEYIERMEQAIVAVREVKLDPFSSVVTQTAQVKRNLDVVSDNFLEYSNMLQDGDYNPEKLCNLTLLLSSNVVNFCQSALTIENRDDFFLQHVFNLQNYYIELISTIKLHAEIGSQRLYSTQARHCLQKVRISISTTNRHLVLMEQLDSQACMESQQTAMEVSLSILSRLAKLLYIARDNLKVETDKAKCSAPRRVLVQAVCSSYECSAQTLLTVKNKVLQMQIKPKAREIRSLIWATQGLLNAADYLLIEIRGTVLEDIESIEFWIGAATEPIVKALGSIAVSIPASLPQSAIMRRKVSSIHSKCVICVEPFQECRAFTIAQ